MDLHCVTKWSKLETTWEGVSLQTLKELGLVVPTEKAGFVIQHAEFGYTANLPLEVIFGENFLLATHYEASRSAWSTARLCAGFAAPSLAG